nr:GatB/YqeY domain-containing protein [Propionibacterium sp.]
MGPLEGRITEDMKAALKAGDKERVSTLRMAIAALKNEKVAGKAARELTEADELRVLTGEVNKRKDSAEAYTAGHRPELAAKELAEAELLQTYLPARLTDAELDALVAAAVADAAAALGAPPTIKQLGQIIKAVNAEAAGRADGGTVAAKVRAALA